MKSRRWLGLGVVAVAAAVAGHAQEPKREDVAQGFRAYIVDEPRYTPPDERGRLTDPRNRVGKMQDLVTDHGLDPVIAVFARTVPNDADHPLISVIAKQDELVDQFVTRRLGAYMVFLALKDEYRKDESRDDRVRDVKLFVAGAKDKRTPAPARTTVGLAEATETPDGTNQAAVPAQVTAMGIGPDDDVVIVLYHRFAVVKRWTFKADAPPTAETLADLSAEVEKLLGPVKKRVGFEPKAAPKVVPKKGPAEEPKKDEPKKEDL